MIWKIILFLLMSYVIIAGISFPIVEKPEAWYHFPLITGLGENAKIIFFHVPTAWITVLAFLMSTIFSIKYLRKKDLDDDGKSQTALELGMVFCILATVTGAVWAKFTWGEYWSWDPRQTSIFALLLIYGALFALRSAVENEEKRATLSAVYSIIAFVTVPFFVFIMPRIMKGLHPGSADDTNAGPVVNFKMNSNMYLVFVLSVVAFTILYFWMWRVGSRSLNIKEKLLKNYR
ncbi:MAG TPA: cytochrome c biogenesis protein CcsA [Ignavibacteriaceae bacterium]|nr:cytochrome c biogenesis protein CcsA [Ignavibacteriaceae bacterium]